MRLRYRPLIVAAALVASCGVEPAKLAVPVVDWDARVVETHAMASPRVPFELTAAPRRAESDHPWCGTVDHTPRPVPGHGVPIVPTISPDLRHRITGPVDGRLRVTNVRAERDAFEIPIEPRGVAEATWLDARTIRVVSRRSEWAPRAATQIELWDVPSRQRVVASRETSLLGGWAFGRPSIAASQSSDDPALVGDVVAEANDGSWRVARDPRRGGLRYSWHHSDWRPVTLVAVERWDDADEYAWWSVGPEQVYLVRETGDLIGSPEALAAVLTSSQ